MMRKFLPLIVPLLIVATFSGVSYQFWKSKSAGVEMVTLPPVQLRPHLVTLSRPAGVEISSASFFWRVTLTEEALAEAGSLALAYGTSDEEPPRSDYHRIPTGSSEGAFQVTLDLPEAARDKSLTLWLLSEKWGGILVSRKV